MNRKKNYYYSNIGTQLLQGHGGLHQNGMRVCTGFEITVRYTPSSQQVLLYY